MSDTVMLSFEINRDSLSALRKDPEHFLPEMRLAAAVKWYELGILSQSKAAEVAAVFIQREPCGRQAGCLIPLSSR
jgi:hypothetical protein